MKSEFEIETLSENYSTENQPILKIKNHPHWSQVVLLEFNGNLIRVEANALIKAIIGSSNTK